MRETAGKTRDSNMELLRIVSMLMVLGVHIDGASLNLPQLHGNWFLATSRDVWQLFVEALCIIGVNCFTLISGYFGIRLRLKSMGVYLFQCIFYAVGIYSVFCLLTPGTFSWEEWGESWLVLTHTDLWYVPAYFCLMLLAPFINAGFSAMKRTASLWITVGFMIYNVWAGWWWEGKFNPSGYTVIQLVMMYMIGRCVAAYTDIFAKLSRKGLIIGSLATFLLMSFLTGWYAGWNPAKAYAYNCPMVIISSVAFLLLFSTLRFRSRAVNYIAKSAFAVYLLHKAPLIWVRYMKPTVLNLWHFTHSLLVFTLLCLLLMAVIYLLAMLTDAVRRFLSGLLLKIPGKFKSVLTKRVGSLN